MADPQPLKNWDIYIGGGVPVVGGPPTLSSATVATTGKTISLVFSEAVSVGAGGNGGWTITPSVNTAAMTYASGSGTNTLVYNLDTYICNTETFTIAYTQPGNGIEATTGGGDVATISPTAGTNSSTVPLPSVWYKCENNAANNTVTATYGTSGALYYSGDPTNTNSNTTTTAFSGSRAYKPAQDATRLIGVVTQASVEDGVFTIQFSYRGDNTTGWGTTDNRRIITHESSEGQIMMTTNGNSSTSFYLSIGGSEFTPITLDNINTNTWHVIRIVVNTGAGSNRVTVYQASTETGLTSKYASGASACNNPALSDDYISFGGSGETNKTIYARNGILDDIKIWYTAVVP